MENGDKQDYLENEYVEIWVSNGIIYETFKPGSSINLAAGRRVVADRLKVSGLSTMPLFVDMRRLVSIDRETRRYMASADALRYLSAGAFLLKGTFTLLAFNTFLIISSPPIPTKGFTDKEKALNWLKFVGHIN